MLEPSIGRRTFFLYSLAYYGILILVIIAAGEDPAAGGLLVSAAIVVMMPVFLYCGVRPRLHDLGHGGIWALLMFVPLINFGTWVILLFRAGKVPSALDLNRALYGVEQPEVVWECPQCQESNPNTTYVCGHCGSRLM